MQIEQVERARLGVPTGLNIYSSPRKGISLSSRAGPAAFHSASQRQALPPLQSLSFLAMRDTEAQRDALRKRMQAKTHAQSGSKHCMVCRRIPLLERGPGTAVSL